MLAVRYDAARGDFERVLKQRTALLRTGVRDPSAQATLDVLDEQLVPAAAELVRGRLQLVERLGPAVNAAYAALGRRRPAGGRDLRSGVGAGAARHR